MTTLRFDTDAGRNTVTMITQSINAIEAELNTLSSRVNSMVGGEWMGNSAQQFQGEFETWAGQLRQTMESLQSLRTRLDQEIQEWEAAASTF